MNKKVGVILLSGDRIQECFLPSYYNCIAGYKHDLLVTHRNYIGINNEHSIENKDGEVYYINKIINGVDIPHRAFGAYRYVYNLYKDKYDIFIFISDDVILKRDNWLRDIVKTLSLHEKLGFGASQIFNGGKKYPHESHLRAPFWFAKNEVLSSINWNFDSDHDGEMKIGDQLMEAGYFGVQVGNKIDLGFDASEPNHITQLIERHFFGDINPYGKHSKLGVIEEKYFEPDMDINNYNIVSPYSHIGIQNIFADIEVFDNLIYLPSLEIAKKYVKVKDIGNNINVIDYVG